MRGVVVVITLGAATGLVAVPSAAQASLYCPDEPFAIPVGNDGKAVALPFEEFKRRLAVLKNLLDTTRKSNPDRERVLQRVETAMRKGRNRTPAETAALASELLLLGKPEDAAGLLAAGDRQGFLSNMTLAHVNAALNDWATATEYLTIANGRPQPAELPGLSPAQLKWQFQINQGPLVRLFEARWRDSRHRPAPDTEEPEAIFLVKFVDPEGVYTPGVLAPSERAKLPPDAIATIQQLLLWFPNDARLYWLLGELYTATGDIAVGRRILDECVSEAWKYGNRKVLQTHRHAVIATDDARPKVAPVEDLPLAQAADAAPPTGPIESPAISMRTIGVYFGIVGAVAVLALLRTIFKRRSTS
ncbi:MAG: tetratricopeptide repeat protein [Gemmataceae bacterium]